MESRRERLRSGHAGSLSQLGLFESFREDNRLRRFSVQSKVMHSRGKLDGNFSKITSVKCSPQPAHSLSRAAPHAQDLFRRQVVQTSSEWECDLVNGGSGSHNNRIDLRG